jgi:hypothetical protein
LASLWDLAVLSWAPSISLQSCSLFLNLWVLLSILKRSICLISFCFWILSGINWYSFYWKLRYIWSFLSQNFGITVIIKFMMINLISLSLRSFNVLIWSVFIYKIYLSKRSQNMNKLIKYVINLKILIFRVNHLLKCIIYSYF